jgi:hypothetical protein
MYYAWLRPLPGAFMHYAYRQLQPGVSMRLRADKFVFMDSHEIAPDGIVTDFFFVKIGFSFQFFFNDTKSVLYSNFVQKNKKNIYYCSKQNTS